MLAEKYIRHYNRLSGNIISKRTLSMFHADLAKDIKNNRIDARKAFGRELIEIEQKISTILKSVKSELLHIELKPVPLLKYRAQVIAPKPVVKPPKKTAMNKAVKRVVKKVEKSLAKKQASLIQSKEVKVITPKRSLSGVNYDYTLMPLGPYESDFYKVYSDCNIMIWGRPGHGKTVYLLKLAKHFAEQGKRALYISEEEYGKSTLDEKLKEHNIYHDNLTIKDELIESDLADYDVIFFDSVNSLGLKPKMVKELEKKYPNKLFVLIVQTTKDGKFRGGQDWEHLVDIAGEIIHRRLVLVKNRLDKDNHLKSDKMLTDDAIASAKKKAHIRDTVRSQLRQDVPKEEPFILTV